MINEIGCVFSSEAERRLEIAERAVAELTALAVRSDAEDAARVRREVDASSTGGKYVVGQEAENS